MQRLCLSNCPSLTSLTIPSMVSSVTELRFENCSNFTSLTIPDSVIDLGVLFLSDCPHLTSLTVPSKISSLNWLNIKNCPIESLTIPKRFTLLLEENVPEGCEVHYT